MSRKAAVSVISLVFHTVFLCLALYALWFTAAFLVPKTLEILKFAKLDPDPVLVPARVTYSGIITLAPWLGGLAIIVAGWSLFGLKAERGQMLLRRSYVWSAAVLVSVACYFAIASYIGMIQGWTDVVNRAKTYRSYLEKDALADMVDEQYEKGRTWAANLAKSKLKEVTAAKEFSKMEQDEKVDSLLSVLATSEKESKVRKLLATLALFKDEVIETDSHAPLIKKKAQAAGAPEFPTVKETLGWIAEQDGEDGWKPLPLYKIPESAPEE